VEKGPIAVIVPAFDEEQLISQTISGLPACVGQIIVIDDGSRDQTAARARAVQDDRIVVLSHRENRGVGAAIFTGYSEALRGSCSTFVVMAGDNQMDPADLHSIATPILEGAADYVKGNRLIHPRSRDMPRARRWGTSALAQVTSWASGQALGDSQCGYTAISRHAASAIDWSAIWSHYGYPNDVLLTLIARGFRVIECPVRPVYGSEKSGLRAWHFLLILGVIARRTYVERHALERGPIMPTAHRTRGGDSESAGSPLRAKDPRLAVREDEGRVTIAL
jgi:glycosyltransferase involved in cell wall biosynthesis